MVFSRDAAIYGAHMRPDLPPLSSAKTALRGGTARYHSGVELALPLTILAFLAFSSQSPMLKVELDNVLDWFVKNDQYFWALTAIIFALPLRMIAIMLVERRAHRMNDSAGEESSTVPRSSGENKSAGTAV